MFQHMYVGKHIGQNDCRIPILKYGTAVEIRLFLLPLPSSRSLPVSEFAYAHCHAYVIARLHIPHIPRERWGRREEGGRFWVIAPRRGGERKSFSLPRSRWERIFNKELEGGGGGGETASKSHFKLLLFLFVLFQG